MLANGQDTTFASAWYEFSAPESAVLYGWGTNREASRYSYLLNIGKVGASAYHFERLSAEAARAVPLYGPDAREDGFKLAEVLADYFTKFYETRDGWV